MSLRSYWLHQTSRFFVEHNYVEWEWDGKTHIFAATQGSSSSIWCHVTSSNAWNKLRPDRPCPAEEATLFRYRIERITCGVCKWMHERYYKHATFMT